MSVSLRYGILVGCCLLMGLLMPTTWQLLGPLLRPEAGLNNSMVHASSRSSVSPFAPVTIEPQVKIQVETTNLGALQPVQTDLTDESARILSDGLRVTPASGPSR
jgi:hypothetical protein